MGVLLGLGFGDGVGFNKEWGMGLGKGDWSDAKCLSIYAYYAYYAYTEVLVTMLQCC